MCDIIRVIPQFTKRVLAIRYCHLHARPQSFCAASLLNHFDARPTRQGFGLPCLELRPQEVDVAQLSVKSRGGQVDSAKLAELYLGSCKQKVGEVRRIDDRASVQSRSKVFQVL